MRGRYDRRYRRDDKHFADGLNWEEHRHSRGGGHRKREHHRGAKTFRRGRAIEFLNRLNVKRSTLKQQLESPELQTINPIIVGELKAVEMIINEFTELFEIHEDEINQQNSIEITSEELGDNSSEV